MGVSFEVRGFNVLFLGGGEEGEKADADSYGGYSSGTPQATEEDDIPF